MNWAWWLFFRSMFCSPGLLADGLKTVWPMSERRTKRA
jgi:hypothetical protein